MPILAAQYLQAEISVPLIIIGAGAAGLTAALAAKEAGIDPLVVERDPVPSGSTALSAGLIPAAGTRFQRDQGIDDSPDIMAADIQRKAEGKNNPEMVETICREAAPTLEWLADRHRIPLSVVADFDYPGHSRRRMHGLPSRTGAEFIDRLRHAVETEAIDLVTERTVTDLYADPDGRIRGVAMRTPDGTTETVACDALILACNGYGGNPTLVREHMPEISGALYFGHPGNQGEAVLWGRELGARTSHLGAYQGHGSVAHPHGILISWAVVMEGGYQVDASGKRFWNESQGYSEAARAVQSRPEGAAWCVYDGRIAGIAGQFGDYKEAVAGGAVKQAETLEDLAALLGLPSDVLMQTNADVDRSKMGAADDAFGRDWSGRPPLSSPFCGVRVTAALFHTQGGLAIRPDCRVLREEGSPLPNLFAAGGAAVGVSGDGDAGYLSGNGLLTAVVLGRLAGQAAAL